MYGLGWEPGAVYCSKVFGQGRAYVSVRFKYVFIRFCICSSWFSFYGPYFEGDFRLSVQIVSGVLLILSYSLFQDGEILRGWTTTQNFCFVLLTGMIVLLGTAFLPIMRAKASCWF